MSVLQRFVNVARGWVRTRLRPDPHAAAARAALEAEWTGSTPPRLRSRPPQDRIAPDPDMTTEADVPPEPAAGPPETDADGNVKRTL